MTTAAAVMVATGHSDKAVNLIIPPEKQVQQSSDSGAVSSLLEPDTVIIDPGHGGPDPGATGVGGVVEKDLNLIIGEKLKDSFEKSGIRVIMTREDDSSIYDTGCITLGQMKDSDLNNRIKIIKNNPQAVFISIHQNYNENASYSGTQVYYSLNDPGSKTLAKLIQDEIKSELEPDNKRKIMPPDSLRVLLQAPTPAVLVECGFITNPQEAASLQDAAYQDKLVGAIEKAAAEFIKSRSGT